MIGRVDDVAPVKKGGDARIDLVERTDEVADVDVLWRVKPYHLTNEYTEILVQRPVGGDPAQRRLPQVNVPVD